MSNLGEPEMEMQSPHGPLRKKTQSGLLGVSLRFAVQQVTETSVSGPLCYRNETNASLCKSNEPPDDDWADPLTATGLTIGTATAHLAYAELGCRHGQQRWNELRNIWPWIRHRRDYTREKDSVSRSKVTSSMISETCSTTWTPGCPTRAPAHGWPATTCFNNSRRRPCRRASSA